MEANGVPAWRGIFWLWFLAIAFQLAGCATLRPGDQERIAGSTYVITGASSGLGRGVAVELGGRGANVVLAARRTELLEEVADKVRAAGGSPLVITTDVADPDAVQRLAEAALQRFGKIDVWINNAGVTALGRFWDIPLQDHMRLIDVNLKGVIYGSYAALRLFRSQGFGTLVNIGSVQSHVPSANQASYSASKAAVLSLGRALDEELRLSGIETIHVVTVLPWAVDTPVWDHAANYTGSTPRLPSMDDPHRVVESIIGASLRPRKEFAVGWKARGARFAHRLFPGFSERLAANIYQSQIDQAPPATPHSGALHEPMQHTRTIEGGIRERIEREDKQRGR
jgi:short-subunit dehydrogenase